MRVILITTILILSLICVAFSIDSMGVIFWISFSVLIGTFLYIEKHQKELERELDDLFDER